MKYVEHMVKDQVVLHAGPRAQDKLVDTPLDQTIFLNRPLVDKTSITRRYNTSQNSLTSTFTLAKFPQKVKFQKMDIS
jgi:hypothetical protein